MASPNPAVMKKKYIYCQFKQKIRNTKNKSDLTTLQLTQYSQNKKGKKLDNTEQSTG